MHSRQKNKCFLKVETLNLLIQIYRLKEISIWLKKKKKKPYPLECIYFAIATSEMWYMKNICFQRMPCHVQFLEDGSQQKIIFLLVLGNIVYS